MNNVSSLRRFPGERVKLERLRLKKTQSEMAALCGVSRETWSRYESDKLEIGPKAFALFVEAGADSDFLTSGISREVFEAAIAKGGMPTAHAQPGDGPLGALISKDEQELLKAFRQGSEDDRAALLRVARQFLK